MTLEHHDQALQFLLADIDRLEPGRGGASPAYLSLYGMLFLMGAVVAARASNGVVARELLQEGQSVAAQLGHDGNEHFTAFGPTNVRLHQISVLADLGDGHSAVEAARQLTPDGLARLPKERRANCYLDMTRGHLLAGRPDEALGLLVQADARFPDDVRCRPAAVSLVAELQRRSTGAPSTELQQLAARVGLANRG